MLNSKCNVKLHFEIGHGRNPLPAYLLEQCWAISTSSHHWLNAFLARTRPHGSIPLCIIVDQKRFRPLTPYPKILRVRCSQRIEESLPPRISPQKNQEPTSFLSPWVQEVLLFPSLEIWCEKSTTCAIASTSPQRFRLWFDHGYRQMKSKFRS
jgi:hypothetical protein